jgi:hypothetical protein
VTRYVALGLIGKLFYALAGQAYCDERLHHVRWMRTTGRVNQQEEKALSLFMLFVLIPRYTLCEKRLCYPLVTKRPTGLYRFRPRMVGCTHNDTIAATIAVKFT